MSFRLKVSKWFYWKNIYLYLVAILVQLYIPCDAMHSRPITKMKRLTTLVVSSLHGIGQKHWNLAIHPWNSTVKLSVRFSSHEISIFAETAYRKISLCFGTAGVNLELFGRLRISLMPQRYNWDLHIQCQCESLVHTNSLDRYVVIFHDKSCSGTLKQSRSQLLITQPSLFLIHANIAHYDEFVRVIKHP